MAITTNKTIKEINAKRHVIKIEDISAKRNTYEQYTTLKTNNLVTSPATNIAIFANEYIPTHYSGADYIKYILEINGVSYEIVPINLDRNGIKIIKASSTDKESGYTHYISEKIKEAYLTIQLKAVNEYDAPFLSNLKVLVGNK